MKKKFVWEGTGGMSNAGLHKLIRQAQVAGHWSEMSSKKVRLTLEEP